VAVRVRIFNQREKDAAGNERIIRMTREEVGSKTFITNPDTGDEKEFKFDYSFNSHKDDPAVGPFATQDTVFNDLGKPVLAAALSGLDVCLFAYGQTGAGKSFSMLGKQEPETMQGIIPRSCRHIFGIIDESKDDPLITATVGIQVHEVYCEQINDLLADRKKWPPNGHKPRMTKDGFACDTIIKPCFNYDDISTAFNFADKNRSVGSHALNPESSRAHTIYQITFEQKKKLSADAKQCQTTTARINLVDLAGSERMESAGTSGQMLKEGNAINLSLTALGNTIKCLSEGKRAQFRESKLTLLLQQSMTKGKVIMIAAVSPSSICFDESMSTLRFAERIKLVKIKATKNVTVDPVAEIKKEMEAMRARMQEEIDELKAGGATVSSGGGGAPTAEMEALKAALEEQKEAEEALKADFERRLKEMNETTEEREARAQEVNNQWSKALGGATTESAANIKDPHFLNLNEDPRLAETLIYKVDKDELRIGRANKENAPDLEFNGMGIMKDHCVVVKRDDKVFLQPGKGARCCVNGKPETTEVEIKHNNRVWLGNNYGFRFAFPGKEDDGDKFEEGVVADYLMAEEELAKHANAANAEGGEVSAINHQLNDALKKVEQANIITGDLSKEALFQPKIIKNRATNEDVVVVQVSLPSGDLTWPWDKFNVRLVEMVKYWQEWQYCQNNDKEFSMPEDNPFVDNEYQLVGEADVWLQSLSNMIEVELDSALILSVTGVQEGSMKVRIDPLDEKGGEGPWEDDREDLDPFVDDVKDLIGKDAQFSVKIPKVTYEVNMSAGGKPKYCDTWIRYKINDRDPDEEFSVTEHDSGNGIEANFNYEKKFKVHVTEEMGRHFVKGKITFQVWGKVAEKKGGATADLLPAGWKRVNAFQAPDGSLHLHPPNKDGTPALEGSKKDDEKKDE